MSNNIIQIGNVTTIFNGGNTLPGCPEDFDQFHQWIDTANKDKDEYYHPVWSGDCGYKLDFDGPIVSASSRFYPPKTHYGPTWDGTVTIYLYGKEVEKKSFDFPTFDELVKAVETYINEVIGRITIAPPVSGS